MQQLTLTRTQLVVWLAVAVCMGAALTLLLSRMLTSRAAYAQEACAVSQTQLEKIYDAVFHRAIDAGALGYIGYDLDFVLSELTRSPEHGEYTKVFSAVKNLENAVRTTSPTPLELDGRTQYLQEIDDAVAEVETWAETLPPL